MGAFTANDIPSLSGKVILITGANSGLGKQAALDLAKRHPAKLWITARTAEKGDDTVSWIKSQVPDTNICFVELDLSSFDSVKAAAVVVLAESERLDVLMLNAGLMGCPPSLAPSGHEIQITTNHLGHALLLRLLLPILTSSPSSPGRVVSLSSSAWKYASRTDKIQFSTLTSLGGVSPVNRYIQSKLAISLYASEFAKRHPKVVIVAVDPGEVDTALFKREPGDEQMKYLAEEVAPQRVRPVEEGVRNQLWAATTGDILVTGGHYEPAGVLVERTGLLGDEELAGRVWEWTEGELDKVVS